MERKHTKRGDAQNRRTQSIVVFKKVSCNEARKEKRITTNHMRSLMKTTQLLIVSFVTGLFLFGAGKKRIPRPKTQATTPVDTR